MAKLGIQLIVFGKRNQDDLPGVLADVKAAGYDGAEMGFKDIPDSEYVELLKKIGLECSGFHTGFATFTDLEALKRQAAQLVALGGKHFMCSGVASTGWDNATLDDYKRSAEVFERAGAALHEQGVHLCYHNHQWEFYDLGDGVQGMNVLAENSSPENVKFCLDVYWLACANENPAAFIEKHADRAIYFHLKDGTYDASAQKPLTFTELGRGTVPLESAMGAIRPLNPEWIVTEQDNTQIEPAESAKISAVFARTALGI
jgi:sugar phosphate isomerase/epimerase